MKKKIYLYEAFSGIGSQFYALKNIAKNLNLEIISLGTIEWYLDAIISYQILHHENEINKNINLSKDEMINQLKGFTFSADAKLPVKENYFSKMKEERLKTIFPYLIHFINNNSNSKDKEPLIREREREREAKFFRHYKSRINT